MMQGFAADICAKGEALIAQMSWKLRSSKFRHVYGSPARRERCYEGLRISRSAHEGEFCAVNPKFLAVVTDAACGGCFTVIRLDETGKIDPMMPKVIGHQGAVLDVKWNPFNDNVIASCSEDTSVRIWYIPDDGLEDNLSEPLMSLYGHHRRVTNILWHPTAENILLSSAYDHKILVWNVNTGQAVTIITCHTDTIYSMAFNTDGSLLATTCKDRRLRVIDPRTGSVTREGQCHTGLKASKVLFLGTSKRLLTTGFNKLSKREFRIWEMDDLSRPLAHADLDTASGTMFPFYDSDTHMLFIAGKGDGNIRYYEIVTEKPYFYDLAEYKSSFPQRGLGFMPKRGLNTKRCEIFRFYKLHSARGLCEPVSMIVPRRSEQFQEDIYPDTPGCRPSLSAEEWLSGYNRPPVLMSLRGHYSPSYTPKLHLNVPTTKPTITNGHDGMDPADNLRSPKTENELRSMVFRQEGEIRNLREELKSRDVRIRQLELELQNYKKRESPDNRDREESMEI
ncbi:coronin-2B-like isoform X1 [Branchiostoma floridae]|uniref:Coronin n=2 Tax=Branchiostoma floridae TaxID=7739 RepID=A0A9J7KUV8_BRAFL|nr:coronin-2B-like isoform X1 [Branchiostoma floridae]